MINVKNLECDVVDICNLKCVDCAHISNLYRHNHYSFQEFESDVIALSKVYHCGSFGLLGGEPLILGNKLLDYINVVRESKISDGIHIITNGILLEKYTDIVKLVDRLEISIYDIPQKEQIERWIASNEGIVKTIWVHYRKEFTKSFSIPKLTDNRAELSWEKCELKTKCNFIYKGYYYRCAQAAKFPAALKKFGTNMPNEGCSLHEENLEERLRAYIERTNRLDICSYCFGHLDSVPWKQEDIERFL